MPASDVTISYWHADKKIAEDLGLLSSDKNSNSTVSTTSSNTATSTTNRNARPSVAPKTGDVAGLVPMGTLVASLVAFGFVSKKKRVQK